MIKKSQKVQVNKSFLDLIASKRIFKKLVHSVPSFQIIYDGSNHHLFRGVAINFDF